MPEFSGSCGTRALVPQFSGTTTQRPFPPADEVQDEAANHRITTDEANALDRVRGGQQPSLQHTLAARTTDDAAAQVADPCTPEEIIGYDSAGAPA